MGYTYTYQKHMSFINPAGEDQWIIRRDGAPMAEAYDPTAAREIVEGFQERDALRAQVRGIERQRDLAEQDARQRLLAQLDMTQTIRDLQRQRDEAHDAAQTLAAALNAAYAHIAADRQVVEQVISSLSDHTCGDMEFCQKTNRAFVLLYEVLERTTPPADAAQVVASRMDEELEALAVLAEQIGEEMHSQRGVDPQADCSEDTGEKIAAEIRARKRGGRVT